MRSPGAERQIARGECLRPAGLIETRPLTCRRTFLGLIEKATAWKKKKKEGGI